MAVENENSFHSSQQTVDVPILQRFYASFRLFLTLLPNPFRCFARNDLTVSVTAKQH